MAPILASELITAFKVPEHICTFEREYLLPHSLETRTHFYPKLTQPLQMI